MSHGKHGHGGGGHGAGHGPSDGHSPVPVAVVHAAGASEALHHHGHVIVPKSTLVIILGLLLFFTLLTVGASAAESLVARLFDVHIPAWVNVVVALSIAVVKTTLVVMFFMQLKYDNPTNSMIFIFCIMTVACFLGFIMIDLGNRETVDRVQAEYVVAGGTGVEPKWLTREKNKVIRRNEQENAGLPVPTMDLLPITEMAKTGAQLTGKAKYIGHGGHGKKPKDPHSNPQQSRPVKGMPDLDKKHDDHDHDDHGHDH